MLAFGVGDLRGRDIPCHRLWSLFEYWSLYLSTRSAVSVKVLTWVRIGVGRETGKNKARGKEVVEQYSLLQ